MSDNFGADATATAQEATRPRRPVWRRKAVMIPLAVVLVLAGGGAVAASLFYASVPVPEQMVLANATTLYYSDGKTVLARLGTNRTLVKAEDLTDPVRSAVIAAEDPSFLTSVKPGGIIYQW